MAVYRKFFGLRFLISRDGSEYAIDDSAAPIRAADGEVIGCVLVFRDVTSERSLNRQLSWQANHDPLTGLVNRREFEQRLSQALNGVKQEGKQQTRGAIACMFISLTIRNWLVKKTRRNG